jgi:hypothetical protein
MDEPTRPWYICEEYVAANRRARRTRRSNTGATEHAEDEGAPEAEGLEGHVTETESSTDDEVKIKNADPDADCRILKMLYKGNLEEANRQEAQKRKSHCVSHKHNVYRNTRCTSTAQEAQSALPAGVINTFEDSEDDEAYTGEQKEIQRECQELRAVESWINQEGWDAAAEARAWSSKTIRTTDLRLVWGDAKEKLSANNGGTRETKQVLESEVLRDYDLEKLDPTQRAFADRVLLWARELVQVYKQNKTTGKWTKPPQLRTWLCGSAGSGKSTTLKAVVQHVRLLFQTENVDATVELTAYTGVAAFNIGFGAKTCCSSFGISGSGAWKNNSKAMLHDASRNNGARWFSSLWTRSPASVVRSSLGCTLDSSKGAVATSARGRFPRAGTPSATSL